jgi:hypothetical protein
VPSERPLPNRADVVWRKDDEFAARKFRLAVEHSATKNLHVVLVGEQGVKLSGGKNLSGVLECVRTADKLGVEDLGPGSD